MGQSRGNVATAALYFAAGVTALATHVAVMSLLIAGFETNPSVASGLGFLAAVPVHFLLQRHVVFRSSSAVLRQLIRYVFFTLSLGIVNVLLFSLLWIFLKPHYVFTQIVTTGVIFVINFFISKNITFARANN